MWQTRQMQTETRARGESELRMTTPLKHLLERAQRRVRSYVKPGRSLVRELLAERRGAAKSENESKPNGGLRG